MDQVIKRHINITRAALALFFITLSSVTCVMADILDTCATPQAIQNAGTIQSPRPTLSGPESIRTTTHFKLHFTLSGTDSTTKAWADTAITAAEYSWSFFESHGWALPPPDRNAGGDDRYDIYIKNLSGLRAAGWNIPDSSYPVPYPRGYSSWIEITNDSIREPFPKFATLRSVVAHEFNHACQARYRLTAFDFNQVNNELWFAENTAVYTEHLVYQDIYDLPYIFSQSSNPLTSPQNPIYLRAFWYSGALWPTFLHEYYDSVIVRRTWEQWATYSGTGSGSIVNATNLVLQNSYASRIDTAFKYYALWRYFTGSRADAYHFKYASLYPTSTVRQVYSSCYPVSGTDNGTYIYGTGGAGFIEFVGPTGGSLSMTFDGGLYSSIIWAVYGVGVRVPAPSSANEFVLNSNDQGTATVPWTGNSKIALVMANLGGAQPGNTPHFSYSASLSGAASVTFINKVKGSNAGGKFLLNGADTVSSGDCRNLVGGLNHQVRTLNERFVSDSIYKHHDWNAVSSKFRLSDTFQVPPQPGEQVANFSGLNPVTMRNELIEAPTLNSGTIQFRDPWYLHSNGTQPDSFFTYNVSTPFSPTGAYNQTTGGVFLNEGNPPQWDQTHYSVRAPQNQPIGGYNGAFIGWTATASNPAQFQYPTSAETPIIFHTGIDTIKARYKGHLVSAIPTALSSSAQRKLVKDNTNMVSMVYESSGTPWFTCSTDNGANWTNEVPVDGITNQNTIYRSPSVFIEPITGWTGIVWEKVECDNPTSSWIHRIMWGEGTSGVVLQMGEIAHFTAPKDSLASPVAASNTSPAYIFVTWRDATSLNYSFSNGYQWSIGQIPSTTSSSKNPVAAADVQGGGGTQRPYRVYVVWEEPGSAGGIKHQKGELSSVSIPASITWTGIATVFNTTSETNASPTLVRDNAGNSCIAWVYSNGGQTNIKYCRVDAGNNIVGSTTFTNCSGTTVSAPSLTDYRFNTTKANDVTLAWSTTNSGVVGAQYTYTAGSWSSPYIVDQSGQKPNILITNNATDNSRSVGYVISGNTLYSITTMSVGQPQAPPADHALRFLGWLLLQQCVYNALLELYVWCVNLSAASVYTRGE
ncbi:MAG: hypothetical protein HYR76_02435 [Ignavibacteria bacterium]|nr:hypothetical protein [Ignavibacteria bacterium]MBI3766254.1 hypothetical protein [Ignavibacteriales bacterium]